MSEPDTADELREELAGEISEHWIKHDINLGQYKSELQCACGDKLIVDGHALDWHSSHTLTVNHHIADKLSVFTAQSNISLLKGLLEQSERYDIGNVWSDEHSRFVNGLVDAVPTSVLEAALKELEGGK